MPTRTRAWHTITLAILSLFLSTAPVFAQAGAAARNVAKELAAVIVEKGGKEAAEDLARMGGESAVREVLEKAAREGGESMAERAAALGRNYGFKALRVIDHAPGKWVGVLEGMSAEGAKRVIWAAEREPELLTKIMTSFGREGVEAAAKHPGVGAKLIDQFGREGVEMAAKLGTDDAVRLASHADELAKLTPSARSQVMGKIAQSPRVVLDFLESHPRILLTGAGVVTVLALKDELLGPGGETVTHPDGTVTQPAPGFIERMTDRVLDRFQQPIWIILMLAGGLLLAWGGIQVWHAWRMKRLKQLVAEGRARAEMK